MEDLIVSTVLWALVFFSPPSNFLNEYCGLLLTNRITRKSKMYFHTYINMQMYICHYRSLTFWSLFENGSRNYCFKCHHLRIHQAVLGGCQFWLQMSNSHQYISTGVTVHRLQAKDCDLQEEIWWLVTSCAIFLLPISLRASPSCFQHN